jgi:lipopolysaccharide export system protein LptA
MIRPNLAAAFIILALSASGMAQTARNERPAERLGLDAGGAEAARIALPAITDAKPEVRPKGATEITARDAMFDNRIHMATFDSDVLVKDPEFGLSCDRLSVYMKKPPAEGAAKAPAKPPGETSSGIEKAVAEGNVVITQDKKDADGKPQRYTGRGERAIFDNTTGTLTLSGWPQISQSISGSVSKQIIAREKSCIIILNRAGKIEVKGYHTSTLQDAESLNPTPR